MDVRVLIVVESEGVRRQLQSATGFPVFATHGHLFRQAQSGEAPAFLASGNLIARYPIEERAGILAHLAATLERGQWQGILIGTDPDDEGDVIAADVAALAAEKAPAAALFRVTWQTLDPAAINRSLNTAQPMEARKNWGAAGLARATVDCMFSGLPGVGRVMTPLLAALSRGGDLDSIRLDFHRPWTLRDVLVMDRGPDVEGLYRRAEALYLDGKLSYPRTGATAFWPETCRTISQVAPGRRIPATPHQSLVLPLSAPHEALHAAEVAEWTFMALSSHDDSQPIERLSTNDAILVSAQAAALVSLGLVAPDQVIEPPDPARHPGAWIVDWQFREGLGRPSTWARRAARVVQSGWLIPDQLALTIDGRRALTRAPDFLRDPALSRQIENHIAIEAARGLSAEEIVDSLRDRLGRDILPEVPQGLRGGHDLRPPLPSGRVIEAPGYSTERTAAGPKDDQTGVPVTRHEIVS